MKVRLLHLAVDGLASESFRRQTPRGKNLASERIVVLPPQHRSTRVKHNPYGSHRVGSIVLDCLALRRSWGGRSEERDSREKERVPKNAQDAPHHRPPV
jgi:hypothetical protein